MLIAIAPLAGLALLAFGSVVAFVLFSPGANPPPVGTRVLVGTVGNVAVEATQQTSTSIQWKVTREDGTSAGSGAGRYEQAPIADMLDVAFGVAGPDAAVTLTFLAEGRTDERARAHGDVTIQALARPDNTWSWSAADDQHDIFAMGEMPSRGASLLKAEEAMSSHLGIAQEGLGSYPAPPQPPPDAVHGVTFDGCTLHVASLPAWMEWARARIVGAFDAASGLPTPGALLDATVGQALSDASHPGCELEELRFGAAAWDAVEPKLQQVLDAIGDETFLAIPGPDELMAAALGGVTPDNRGTKERAGSWAIVVRPQDGAEPAKVFAWWSWNGARLLDSDAELHGWAATQAEALALAKQAIAGLPANVHAEAKG